MTRSVNSASTIFDDRIRLAADLRVPRDVLISRNDSVAFVRRRGGGTTARLVVERTGLVHHRLEIAVAVAERDAPLANRHAAICFAIDAAIHGDELVGRSLNLDEAIHQDLAAAVHRDEV